MITRADIVDEARTWIDTPFHHQGRLKGVGVDCAGVIIGVAHALKLSEFDCRNYGREPTMGQMRILLEEHMIKVVTPLPGDALLFSFDVMEQHLGMFTDANTIIHAYEKVGKCVEHRYSDLWLTRTRGIYQYKGIA